MRAQPYRNKQTDATVDTALAGHGEGPAAPFPSCRPSRRRTTVPSASKCSGPSPMHWG